MLCASRVVLVVTLAVVAMTACSTTNEREASHSDAPNPMTGDEFTLPSTAAASKSIGPATNTISGVLVFDDIEGGCAFVEAADGTRYEVIYPDGWTLDRSAAELRTDEGGVVRAGDRLTVRGAIARDRSSVCQVGPIFVAVDVEVESP